MQEIMCLGSAYLAGLLASRLTFPPLVGYLLAGYLLNLFNVEVMHNLTHLADIGIELLLFTVGLKLKLNSLLRREVRTVGGLHLLIVSGVSGAVFVLQGEHITGALILGASLAFSSTVLAIKVLEDNGELSSLHGRDVLSILILQDIVAIALLAVADGKQPTPWAFGLLLLPLLRPVAHFFLNNSHSELRLLLGVSMALAGGFLAEYVSISADVGALLTGIMLASHPKSDDLAKKLWGIKELLLVAFFLQIGLASLPNREEIMQAAELLALLPLQGILFFVLFLFSGLRARTAFVSSLALMTYSEFALITTDAMVNADLLNHEWKSIISLAVAGSLALAAPLNKFSHQLFNVFEPYLSRFEKKSGHPDRLPVSIGLAEWVVVGMGKTGVAAYLTLQQQDLRVVALDSDPIVLEKFLSKGLRVVYGDAEDNELWNRLPLERLKGILLTMPDFQVRSKTVKQLMLRDFRGQVGTICYHSEEQQQLELLGAHFVIHPFYEAGCQLAKQITGNGNSPQQL
ncbi:MAG: cation:proton antiporter [Methylococcales bacterium]|nr:cation:proton antiporter [Methylococcales bacterium]